ncbi:transposase [Micromonospora sp. WMMD882]|uniref:transposase n=1 Tax=Micromonospora sp. WMMD882 TaxID=3015151 RepID=UPI00248BAE49|nr:transposase [Micromonospora sp. WMMD882]WBB82321.1 transposase [Micromonospora sp. WMMD882]
MWAGTGGEGAKQWAGYLTELRNRGVEDVFLVCFDGLKGMTDAIEQVWPQAVHQQWVVHLVRASLRYTNRHSRFRLRESKPLPAHAIRPTACAGISIEFWLAVPVHDHSVVMTMISVVRRSSFDPFISSPPPHSRR